jgi:hypothetical protein
MLICEKKKQKQKLSIETDMPLFVTWLMISESNFYSTTRRSEHLTAVSTRVISWVGKGSLCVGLLIV